MRARSPPCGWPIPWERSSRGPTTSSLLAGFAPFALLGPALGAASVTPVMDVTKPATLTASALADAAIAGQSSVMFASPAALANVVQTAGDLTREQRAALAGVRQLLSAGAPVHPALLRQLSAVLPHAEVHTPYGMTEGLLLSDIDGDEIERLRRAPDALYDELATLDALVVTVLAAGGTTPAGASATWPP